MKTAKVDLLKQELEFQFPSNGKVYPKPQAWRKPGLSTTMSFNSLQTGQVYPKDNTAPEVPTGCVFQFPSNGKVYPKSRHIGNRNGTPFEFQFRFKREGVSKAKLRSLVICSVMMFQFPSNGKVHP